MQWICRRKEELILNLCQDYGGIAVIIGFIVSAVYLIIALKIEDTIALRGETQYFIKLIGFFSGITILGIMCFIDDMKNIPAIIKLIVQIIAAIIVVLSGIRIEGIDIPFLNLPSNEIITYIITICWIVGITNAINLIDGLDGLSSGITLISCISLLMIFALNDSPIISIILITALAGAISGFLPFNINPAKTYVGDVGAQFYGFAISIISILGMAKTYTAIVIIAPLIVLLLPICDTLFAIIRRTIKGKSIKAIMKPDMGHLHHKLMKKGYSQKQAVFILYGASATCGIFAIILLESGIWKAISFALIVVAMAAIGYKDILKIKKKE